jgi:hypothetical protein
MISPSSCSIVTGFFLAIELNAGFVTWLLDDFSFADGAGLASSTAGARLAGLKH